MTNARTLLEAGVLTIKVDLADVVKELSGLGEHWQQRAERLRTQWEESEWYLGETRATVGRLEEQLHAVHEASSRLEAHSHEVAVQLREQVRQRHEANWYLGELRATHEALRQQNQQLTKALAQAQDDVEVMRRAAAVRQEDFAVERARRKALEVELGAVRRYGERRRAVRIHGSDIVAEVRALDGLLLFHGSPPDISLTGLAFATDRAIDEAPDFVEITLHVPETERPIEALGRLVWRDALEGSHQWGCELVDLLPDSRKSLEAALATTTSAPPMLQRLIIVDARDSDLYDEIRRTWFGDATVKVITDRRRRERRQQAEPHRPERRRGERRRYAITAALLTERWAEVPLASIRGEERSLGEAPSFGRRSAIVTGPHHESHNDQ